MKSFSTFPRAERSDLPVFGFCVAACFGFVVLTLAAMLFYPGGRWFDAHARGYTFTLNFLSDLGRTHALNHRPNPVSSVLFTFALTLAGLALAVFFIGFARFFGRTLSWKCVSWMGTFWGVFAGLCFVGVGWAPADTLGGLHHACVGWAFRAYLIAVSLYSAAIWSDGRYPKRMAWVFVGFAVLLLGYIWILIEGPRPDTQNHLLVQVVAQKIIVYASILATGAQAAAAHFYARRFGVIETETTAPSGVN